MSLGLGLALGGASSLFSVGSGLFQRAKARKLDKQSIRPVYTTPAQIALNQKMAQGMAAEGMNGQQYNNASNNITRNTSAGLAALTQQRNGLGAVGNIVAHANDATLDLDVQDAELQRKNEIRLMQENQNVADYEDKAFQYNKADKYAEEQAKIAALRGAGNTNIGNGFNNIASIALAAYQSGMFDKKPKLLPKDTLARYQYDLMRSKKGW